MLIGLGCWCHITVPQAIRDDAIFTQNSRVAVIWSGYTCKCLLFVTSFVTFVTFVPLLWRFDNNSYYLPVYLPCNNSLHRLTAAPRHARIDDDRNDEKESRRWRQPHVHSVLLQNALFCKSLHLSWDFLRIVGWGIGFLDVETSGGLGTLSQSISLWIAMDARQQSESEVP